MSSDCLVAPNEVEQGKGRVPVCRLLYPSLEESVSKRKGDRLILEISTSNARSGSLAEPTEENVSWGSQLNLMPVNVGPVPITGVGVQ